MVCFAPKKRRKEIINNIDSFSNIHWLLAFPIKISGGLVLTAVGPQVCLTLSSVNYCFWIPVSRFLIPVSRFPFPDSRFPFPHTLTHSCFRLRSGILFVYSCTLPLPQRVK